MGSTEMARNKVVPITDGVGKPKRQRTGAGSGRRRIGIEIYTKVVREPEPAASIAQNEPKQNGGATRLTSLRRTTKVQQHNESRYWIAADDRVSVAPAEAPGPADAVLSFSTIGELRTSTSEWPMRHFVSIWNRLPGKRRVTRFENRSIAVERLWRAIEKQSPAAVERKSDEGRPARRTKTECMIALLQAPKGATLEALMEATGWQAHSVRGFLSRKVGRELGMRVESLRRDGKRIYCLPPVVCTQPE